MNILKRKIRVYKSMSFWERAEYLFYHTLIIIVIISFLFFRKNFFNIIIPLMLLDTFVRMINHVVQSIKEKSEE